MRKKGFFILGLLFIFFSLTLVSAEILFIRGDANFDQKVDLADSIFINNYLYKGGSPPYCMDAADINDDGRVDLSDGVYLNNYLYLGTGSPPPQPYPDAGIDSTVDGLDCGPDGQGGVCQSSFCDIGIKESAEGPGGSFCACSDSKGDAGFEECYDYKTKSTATIPQFLFDPAKQATDYCKDSQTLIEVAIDCEWASQDILDFKEKNCNDLNVPGPWSNYYCESNEVKRRRTLPDYECGNGACYVGGGGYEEDILSRLGNSDYCAVKKSKCGVGCTQGEYDCDSNSECSTGLVCLGPEGGAADGCCKSGQIWDTTNFQCDDCKPTDGPCCDSKGKFRPDTVICNNNLGTEYSCKNGNCLGNNVYKKVDIRYCSGTSSSCNGVRAEATSIEEYCDSTQFCSGSTTWGSTKPSCKNAQCIDGECCDNTCGVYTFKGNDLICDFKWDEGCPWGTDLGNDAGKRSGGIVCSGTSNTCGDGPLRWRDWFVKKDCLSNEYCAISSIDGTSYCRTIDCAQDSDCGSDEWLDETFCKNNDVYDKQRIWTCNNPGKKESSCSSIVTDRKKEDCVNGCETLSPTSARCKSAPPPATCSDGIKNQDETDIDCGGTICGKCSNTKSCKISNDCQSNYCNPSTLKCENPPAGCTDNDKDGYGLSGSTGCSKSGIDCNDNNANINPGVAEICGNGIDENCNGNRDDVCQCSNECSPQGSTRCSSSSVRQSCGNYDADSCLEWGGDMNCQYGCSSNQCNAAPPQGPDLTVTSLVVQWPITTPIAGQDITMAFTLKNLGTVSAPGIFWKLDTGSPDPDPVNSIGLSLDAGKSITVFTRIKYAVRGTYTTKAIVDYQNRIAESNEGNNEMSRSITVN